MAAQLAEAAGQAAKPAWMAAGRVVSLVEAASCQRMQLPTAGEIWLLF